MYLSAGGFRRADGHDRRVLERAVLLERLRERRDGRVLLPDRDVDAEDVAALLVDDRIDRDRGLAGAAVADDQLALTLADRDQRVDRADAGLQRLLDRLTLDDARRGVFDRAKFLGLDRAFAVDRDAQRIHDAAQKRFADGTETMRPVRRTCSPSLISVSGPMIDDADVVLFEVEHDALQAVGKLDEFRLLHGLEPVDARDVEPTSITVPTSVFVDLGREVGDLAP